MTSGIYRLNFPKENFYIGRSCNIESRIKGHKSDLKLGKHNSKMQEAYTTLGSFISYDIIEECPLDAQIAREIYWIKETEAVEFGLNKSTGGYDICVGEANSSSKYSNSEIIEAFLALVEFPNTPLQSISKSTGISINVIKSISNSSRHGWLKDTYPIEYEALLSNSYIRAQNSLNNLTDKYQFKKLLSEYPKIISPEGVLYTINTLGTFAKEHNLHEGNLSSVLNGRRKSHKGWKLAEGELP